VLDYLRIQGLALLDDVELELGPGMNVLTGETGAGESIIVGALALVRGGRGRKDLVREGCEQLRIEAQFVLEGAMRERVTQRLAEHGIELEDDVLVIERVVQRSGRGRSRVQSRLTTRAVLASIGQDLVDICSQHEHHSLTHVARHRELLDGFAGTEPVLASFRAAYQEWVEVCGALGELRRLEGERLRRVDYLRFQIDELDAGAQDLDRITELRERLALVRDARQWEELAAETVHVLYEADDAIVSRLGRLLDRLGGGPEAGGTLSELAELLETAQVACDEAASVARRLAGEVEVEPEELEQLEDRVHAIVHLERKHGVSAAELGPRLSTMRAELAELEGADDRESELSSRESELARQCETHADELSAQRRAAATDLGRQVEAELAALHLEAAHMEVACARGDAIGAWGRDAVELRFSANDGEPVGPLNKVASGGELSRVLLAIKSVLSVGDRVATYVFDEVDAGVGGAVAEAIARRLARTSTAHQVLCITHLPQIAAHADRHFLVGKRRSKGRTVTRVQRLDEPKRVGELARMLGGDEVGESARKHARALIDHASTSRRDPRS
jgi:DNA repair protein RecN (Recombination protein N)